MIIEETSAVFWRCPNGAYHVLKTDGSGWIPCEQCRAATEPADEADEEEA